MNKPLDATLRGAALALIALAAAGRAAARWRCGMQTAAAARLGRPPARVQKVMAPPVGSGHGAQASAQLRGSGQAVSGAGWVASEGSVDNASISFSDALPPVAWAQVRSVPKPATLLFWLAGLAALLAFRRRQSVQSGICKALLLARWCCPAHRPRRATTATSSTTTTASTTPSA